MMYPLLPTCPPQGGTESRTEYASRILRFLMETDCYATVDTESLEQAESIARMAVAAPGMAVAALDTISGIRTRILRTIAARRADNALDDHQAASPIPPAVRPAVRPNDGQRVKLIPPTPIRPSGGIAVADPF
jgi:hypothetical protein